MSIIVQANTENENEKTNVSCYNDKQGEHSRVLENKFIKNAPKGDLNGIKFKKKRTFVAETNPKTICGISYKKYDKIIEATKKGFIFDEAQKKRVFCNPNKIKNLPGGGKTCTQKKGKGCNASDLEDKEEVDRWGIKKSPCKK